MSRTSLKGRTVMVAHDLNNQGATDSKVKKTNNVGEAPKEPEQVVGSEQGAPTINSIMQRATKARAFLGNALDKDRQGQRTEVLYGRFLGVDFHNRTVTLKDGTKEPKLHPVTQLPMVTAIIKIGVYGRGTLEIFCPKTFWDTNRVKTKTLVTIPVIHVRAGDVIGDPADPKSAEPATMDGIGVNGSINECDVMEFYSRVEDELDREEREAGRPLHVKRQIMNKMLEKDLERMFVQQGGAVADEDSLGF